MEAAECLTEAEEVAGAEEATCEAVSGGETQGGAPPQAEWDILTWVRGFEGATVHAAVGEVLRQSKQSKAADLRGEYEWCRELARQAEGDPALIARTLGPALVEAVSAVLAAHLHALQEQDAATAAEQNDKFVQGTEGQLRFGTRKDFDGGLNELIGYPNDEKVLAEMYREHCEYKESAREIFTNNYGVTTTPLLEWKAAAGRWEPLNKSFETEEGFLAPRETKNIRPDHCRRIFSLDKLTQPPSPDEEREWASESEEGATRAVGAAEGTDGAIVERARRCVWLGNLTKAEVLAVRLWSGPMYLLYNSVLRGWGGGFTTTLHAVHSGIFKLSQVSPPERVYRGVANRAITGEDMRVGSFVEMNMSWRAGAQSFSRDKNVALAYSRVEGKNTASYVFEVQEGEVDRGADISPLSYYPQEREKLYGALSMMQVVGARVERVTVVLKLRVNVNTKAGTLDEVVNRKHAWLKASAAMLLLEAEVSPAVRRLEDVAQQGAPGCAAAAASRLGDLREMLRELEEEPLPRRFNDSEVFMQRSRALTDTWKRVLRHAELVEAADELVTQGEAGLGPEIAEAETHLLRLRVRARLGRLEARLGFMRVCRRTGLVLLWQVVVWAILLVYSVGVLSVIWIMTWSLDTVLGLLSMSLFSPPLANLQAHWVQAVLATFNMFVCAPSSEWLDPEKLPWSSVTLALWGVETSALSSAVEQLRESAADASTADAVGGGRGLHEELQRATEAVQQLWARGGVLAKEEECSGSVRRTVMEALAGLSTTRLAEVHRGERFRKAVEHLVESCRELPMNDASTRVQFRGLRDTAREACLDGSSMARAMYGGHEKLTKLETALVDGAGQESRCLEQKLWWMGEEEALKRRSVSRLLELFRAGTDSSKVTLRSSEMEDDWEAEHMGFFLCGCEYLDAFPLDQVCTGKLTKLEALVLSRQQAAMLARLVVLQAPGDVTLTVGEYRYGVLLGRGAAAEQCGLNIWGRASGAIVLPERSLTIDVLRAVVASARASARSSPEGGSVPMPSVKRLVLNGMEALGAGDGGVKAAELVMELACRVFPELEELHCRGCLLGDGAAAKLAAGVAQLPKLRKLVATQNRVGLRGKRALQSAWSRARKPNNFWRAWPDHFWEEEVAVDAVDTIGWGAMLPMFAWALTCCYCCSDPVPIFGKSRRVADSSQDKMLSGSVRGSTEHLGPPGTSGGESTAAWELPEALRMESSAARDVALPLRIQEAASVADASSEEAAAMEQGATTSGTVGAMGEGRAGGYHWEDVLQPPGRIVQQVFVAACMAACVAIAIFVIGQVPGVVSF
ncbi:hypothetical protein T484DRAFT_1888801 [Baffinella frigidus]|nr:hypothetical protein T484DRAFT_1888801 [Cryptophyta sp. CCMP2293]